MPRRRIRSPCCARAASGHAATAPPSAASNSRRPMVTVIRPSRARCVKGTIPRLQRAVFTFEEAGCWLLPPQSPALTALLPPPALGERRHRCLARRLVVVRWRGRYAAGGGGGGFGGLGGGGFGGFGGSMEAIHPRL